MGKRFSVSVHKVPGAHPSSYPMGAVNLPRNQNRRGVALNSNPHLQPRVKKDYNYRCNLLNNVGVGGGKLERGLERVKSRSQVRKRENVLNQRLIYRLLFFPFLSKLLLFAPLQLVSPKSYSSLRKTVRGILGGEMPLTVFLYPSPKVTPVSRVLPLLRLSVYMLQDEVYLYLYLSNGNH